jgi:hypothetical protein
MANQQWTNRELRRLKECYPVMTPDQLIKEFPRHPIRSIYMTAFKAGIKKQVIMGSRKYLAIAKAHKPVFNFGPATDITEGQEVT